jgi:multidrug transporter EmrE-like cation transporter
MHIVFLVIALVFNALANILMKLANLRGIADHNSTLSDRITGVYFSWPFITGLFLFGLNLLCYTFALSKMHLSVAYPIMVGAGFAIIGISSYFLFNERLTPFQITGTFMILIGVTLLAYQSNGG